MLHMQISPQTGVPIYRQVIDQVKYYVASRTLSAGDQLPSIRELAKELHVNPMTIVKAYTKLEHEGVVEMKHGKGAFIAETAGQLSAAEQEEALRRLTRQLVVEAAQMDAPVDLLIRIVREEVKAINKR